MSFDALMEFALLVQFDCTGLPIAVTRPAPDDTPVTTTGVWIQRPLDESRPYGKDFQQGGPRKVLGIIRTTELPTVPRGTVIFAAELEGGTVKTWRVDGYEAAVEPDLMRVILVQTADSQ